MGHIGCTAAREARHASHVTEGVSEDVVEAREATSKASQTEAERLERVIEGWSRVLVAAVQAGGVRGGGARVTATAVTAIRVTVVRVMVVMSRRAMVTVSRRWGEEVSERIVSEELAEHLFRILEDEVEAERRVKVLEEGGSVTAVVAVTSARLVPWSCA